jgi:hypothetical protein
MAAERPPPIDAEYRLVHGPWPRWVMHLSLVKLGVTAAAVVVVCLLVALGVMAVAGVFG